MNKTQCSSNKCGHMDMIFLHMCTCVYVRMYVCFVCTADYCLCTTHMYYTHVLHSCTYYTHVLHTCTALMYYTHVPPTCYTHVLHTYTTHKYYTHVLHSCTTLMYVLHTCTTHMYCIHVLHSCTTHMYYTHVLHTCTTHKYYTHVLPTCTHVHTHVLTELLFYCLFLSQKTLLGSYKVEPQQESRTRR